MGSLSFVIHNMGLVDGLLGNASSISKENARAEVEEVLIEKEVVQKGFKVIRDLYVFTNKRLIIVDKQGLTGRKTEHSSIPYKSITSFAIESAGTFDMDAELKLWVRGHSAPIVKQFKKGTNLMEIQQLLSINTL